MLQVALENSNKIDSRLCFQKYLLHTTSKGKNGSIADSIRLDYFITSTYFLGGTIESSKCKETLFLPIYKFGIKLKELKI